MKFVTLIRCALSCALFLLTITLYAQATATIAGTINSELGTGLDGVNVVLKSSQRGAITDADGRFLFENMAAGDHTLIISSIGFETLTRTVRLRAGERKEVSFRLNNSMTTLSEITIRGEALDPRNRTITVNELDREQIQRLNINLPVRMVEQIPGVDLLSYNQGGVADQFSIRGFGGGGHEGQAGAQIDGVSLNEAEGHSDGYADLNILIPLNVEKLTVYKGPSSVLFGRFAEGGTLAFETRKGGDYQDVSISGGAFNTLNAQYALGKNIDLGGAGRALESNLAFQFFQSDGYAENSDNLRGNLTGRLAYQITDKTDIAINLRGHRSEWDAAGYISEEQVEDEELRTLQAPNAENDGGAKQFYSQKLDVNHTFNDSLRLLVFGYAVQQEFTRFAKFGTQVGGQTERFNTRDVYAVGASLNGKQSFAGVSVNYIAGAEFYTEGTERMRWVTSNRVRGERILNRDFGVQTFSAYAQTVFDFGRYLRPSIGLRYDRFFGSFNSNDPGQPAFSNDIDGLANVSPKLGVRSTIASGLDIRVSASNGFSLPNSAAKYEADLDLEPVRLWQYELGASYTDISWLQLDVVGFILNSSNEIFENPPGSGDLVNVGATQRRGVESEAILTPLPRLRARATYAYTETEIEDNPTEDLEGKALVNIPQNIATLDLSYALQNGLGAQVLLRDVGPYFTDSANTASYDGYTVTNLAVFYNFSPATARNGRIFVEVRNLFDSVYSETVFGGPGEQIFTPAPTRHVMAGLTYSF